MTAEQESKIMNLRKAAEPAPQPETVTAPPAPESVTPPAEVVVENKAPEVVETPKPEKVEPEVAPTQWDTDEAEVVTPSSVEIDFTQLGSALEFGETKTKEEFIAKASEFKNKLKEIEGKPLAGVPEEFREIIEVAKAGDWKEYLSSQLIDFTKLDPVDEFENDFFKRASTDQRYFTDGKFDEAKVNAALDQIPDVTKEVFGQQLLQAEATKQAQQRAAIKAKAQERLANAEKSLAQATSKLQEILPLENYGIKFEPKHSSEIYNGIVNSKLTKKHLGMSYEDLVRSGADMKAVTRSITLAEKGEKMISFKSANSKVEAKKEILKETQNVQLNPSSSVVNPESPETKIESPVEKLKKHLSQQARVGL